MTDCGRHTLRGWVDEHAGSWAWFEAPVDMMSMRMETRAVFDVIGRLEWGARVKFDRRLVGLRS